jgi:NAD(P)H-nitrite reductase large subunit
MSLHQLDAATRTCPDPCAGPCSGCPDRVVCRCLKVTEEVIVESITTLGLCSVREVREVTRAGDGCTCCHREIRELLVIHAPSTAAANVCVNS